MSGLELRGRRAERLLVRARRATRLRDRLVVARLAVRPRLDELLESARRLGLRSRSADVLGDDEMLRWTVGDLTLFLVGPRFPIPGVGPDDVVVLLVGVGT